MGLNRRHFLAATAALGAFPAPAAAAQKPYPTRPVRLIVPYRPGAGTAIGADYVAHAEADGYTFLLGDLATYAANPSLYKKLSYDPRKDFSPISLTGRFAVVLLVNTNKLKVSSLAELVDAAKKAPGVIDYASGGVGNPFHLASEMLAQAAGIKLNHIPYKGAAPALQDLVAGQVGMMFVDFATARSQLATPGIKALAVAATSELPGLPGVPTVASSYPGFEVWAWQGFVAPAATPAEIIARLRESYIGAIGDAEIRKKLNEAGIDVLQSTPAEFASYMNDEAQKWAKVIKTANIQID
ncbi:tripartite tricarboxylate transporter substrate-binding protein [Bradyrhizobium sp. NP1]|uniref:Bug family tripartite tricarboxylate transporter substrate binding protein n=1 Tax=Bradyrhizobium sp. NP1 TaxID=3049772 RepID=UPI0025A59D34|nr:tripartite tricarboxylate transporter substrate-binding protein [Bradyrhizobium sp. NP1]WJR75097.1 tripartite tricarboxylate transporter substrate-binding protein [Bradyrhizobium sp. NP1]